MTPQDSIGPDTAYSEAEQLAILQASGAIDAAWYGAQVGGVANLCLHYLRHGESAGLWPNADFDPRFYNAAYPPLQGDCDSALVRHLLAHTPSARPTSAKALGARIAQLDQQTTPHLQGPRPTLSYCTPVMGRFEDVIGTFGQTLPAHIDFAGQVEFVVMSFDQDTRVMDWLAQNFGDYIRLGLLRPIQSGALDRWHFGRAKNAVAGVARGLMVSSLDADNFVTPQETQQILDVAQQTDHFAMIHHFSGQYGDGTSGRLTMPASVLRTTGYDAQLLPRQFDEVAAILRALHRYAFLPFYCYGGAGDVLSTVPAIAEFCAQERLANARRQLPRPPYIPPLNPNGAGYAQEQPALHWAGTFNSAQVRFGLARGAKYKEDIRRKAVWAARELVKTAPAPQLAGAVFDTAPKPAQGLTVYTVLSGNTQHFQRFCSHHLDLGAAQICAILPPDIGLGPLPAAHGPVQFLRARAGHSATMTALWLETAFRCTASAGGWGVFLMPAQFIRPLQAFDTLPNLAQFLEDSGKSCLFAFLAPSSRPNSPPSAKHLFMLRNVPNLHLGEGLASLHSNDPSQKEGPWQPSDPKVMIDDYDI